MSFAFLLSNATGDGGAGGAGGAGLLFVCRGASFGVNGLIDLSGGDGAFGGSIAPLKFNAGTGAGGAPGACVFFLDGANSNIPDLGVTLNSSYGLSTIRGKPIPAPVVNNDLPASPAYSYYTASDRSGHDMAGDAYGIQFLTENTAKTDDRKTPPSDVTGFSAVQNGQVVVFRWNRILDDDRDGYEIRYHPGGPPNWDNGTRLTQEARGTEITSAAISPGSWTMMIKAIDFDGNFSVNPAFVNLVVTNTNDIIFQQEQSPNWIGEISAYGDAILDEDGTAILCEDTGELKDETAIATFVRHWTGALIPNSQDPAAGNAILDEDRSAILDQDGSAILDEAALDFSPILDEDGTSILDQDGTMIFDEASIDAATPGVFEIFDTFVVNPVPTSQYEAKETDISFDSLSRVWSQVSGVLGPGQVGSFDTLKETDFRLAAGIYGGFQTWSVGFVTARYLKQRFSLDNLNGIGYIASFLPTVDIEERSEEGVNVAVAAGGTPIVYGTKFHNVPNLQVTTVGSSALIALSDVPTVSGFTARVLNSAGTGIGGTINWRATGS